jgi:hypothetical protein
VTRSEVSKKEVTDAIFYHHYGKMKEEMESLSKLTDLRTKDLRKPRQYLASKCLAEARMAAKVDLMMVDCLGNMKARYQGRMTCKECEPWRKEGEEAPTCTQAHLMECQAYSFIQQEHNDMEVDFESLTRYFMDVMWIRA